MKKTQKTKQTLGIFRVAMLCLALAGLSQFLMGGCGGDSSGSSTPPPATAYAPDSIDSGGFWRAKQDTGEDIRYSITSTTAGTYEFYNGGSYIGAGNLTFTYIKTGSNTGTVEVIYTNGPLTGSGGIFVMTWTSSSAGTYTGSGGTSGSGVFENFIAGGSHETITVTNPVSSTVWTVGNVIAVDWSNAEGTSVDVFLYRGDTMVEQFNDGTANDGHINDICPDSQGSDIRVKIVDENDNYGWSEFFTINIGGGTGEYVISGTVSGSTRSGVSVTLSGDSSDSTTTAADGTYSFTGLVNGSYTVTAEEDGYIFIAPFIDVILASVNETGADFNAVSREADVLISDLIMNFKGIPAGTFTMGSPLGEPDRGTDEGPQHSVMINQNFWMASTEVTQAQYETIIGSNPSFFTGDTSFPVEQVSWNDAVAFCVALTTRETANIPAGYAYRLPTEAEWEYCCRAGTSTNFSYGQDDTYANLGTYAWYDSNSGSTTHPVSGITANPWGLYDMHGNVWEWCHDWYSSGYYTTAAQSDPVGPATGSDRVDRGGGWGGNDQYCRSANRSGYTPTGTSNYLGFRVVLAPVLPQP